MVLVSAPQQNLWTPRVRSAQCAARQFLSLDAQSLSVECQQFDRFTGSVFQDPARPNDVTQVFIGANGLGVQDGSLVGISFDRTVTCSTRTIIASDVFRPWISLSCLQEATELASKGIANCDQPNGRP